MKISKEIKIYCKKCNEHTVHKLKQFKEGAKSILKEHARKHERKHNKGYGGKSRFVVHIKKQSKKPTFLATCVKCNQKAYFVAGNKSKKKPEIM